MFVRYENFLQPNSSGGAMRHYYLKANGRSRKQNNICMQMGGLLTKRLETVYKITVKISFIKVFIFYSFTFNY